MNSKYYFIPILTLFFVQMSTGQRLNTYQDSVSYAAGVSAANDLLSRGGKNINSQLFLEAFKSYFDTKEALITPEIAQTIFSEYIVDSWEKENRMFLVENIKKSSVKVLPSGLQYEILNEGMGEMKPTSESTVIVHYEGSLINGKVFDSSIQRDQVVKLNLANVIEGWAEGLQLMKTKDKFRLFIPADLAYGEEGAGNVIPPHSTLIFEVELLTIE